MIIVKPQTDKAESLFKLQLQRKLDEYRKSKSDNNKSQIVDNIINSVKKEIKKNVKKEQDVKKGIKQDIKKDKSFEKYEGPPCRIAYIDKIYCLNLESCHERKENMKKQFLKKKWNATFVNGIYPQHPEYRGKYGNPAWIDQTWDKPRCYCKHKCDHKARRLRPTEVAIAMSHGNVYKKIVKNHCRWALVCEDDLIFIKPFTDILTEQIPENIWNEAERPIIIFLGGANDNIGLQIQDPSKFELVKLSSGCYSNYCFLINYAAAKFLSKKIYPIKKPDDSFKRYWIGAEEIDSYRIRPSMVAELSAGTNMKAIYNRWSRGRAPPRVNALIDDEYAPQPIVNEVDKKPKRLIIYNKTRYTVLKNDLKKKKKKKLELEKSNQAGEMDKNNQAEETDNNIQAEETEKSNQVDETDKNNQIEETDESKQ